MSIKVRDIYRWPWLAQSLWIKVRGVWGLGWPRLVDAYNEGKRLGGQFEFKSLGLQK